MLTTIPASFSTSSDQELLTRLQQQPHRIQVLVDADGTPVVAWISSAAGSYGPLATLGQYMLEAVILQMSSPPEALSDAAYQLRPGLVVDLGSYEVIQGQTKQHLTPCEAEVLSILLQQPRRYVSVEKLTRMTRLRYARRPKRSLQETISDLHKKLGEKPRRPSLLRCLEGKSYALFPQGSLQPEQKLAFRDQKREPAPERSW